MPCLSLKHIHNSRAISRKYRHQKKLAKKAILSQKAGAKVAARVAAKASRQSARQAAAAARAAERASRLAKATENTTNNRQNSRITEESIHIPHHTPSRLPDHPSRADLINAESRLGSTIFGPVPQGHRREFFHDRENVWIWHEDWQDENQHPCQFTVRYEVRNSGIYKKVATGKYLKLEGDELINFRKATYSYLCLVKKYLYHTPQITNAA